MRYHALAADFDGTLARHGYIDDATWAALRRLRDSGRRAIMVTGRELPELLERIEHPELFERIVAENGALIYDPRTKEIRTDLAGPPAAFVAELERRGVKRISVGHVIVATWEPHQDTVLHVIRDMGLELQVIFNKGAVMILPSGVNKATGLAAALHELALSPHNVIGIGDAENDHALLAACECGVAVANALPSLKETADVVTDADHGAGVAELIERLVRTDLAAIATRLKRHYIPLGRTPDREVAMDPYATNLMVCGTSGSGKSVFATALLERLHKAGYQFAVVDPEGDFNSLDFAVQLGGPQRAPLVQEVVDVLKDPQRNVTINMLGVAVEHRPGFFGQLLPALAELRTRSGRPHLLVIDEAHHLLPASWDPAAEIAMRPHGTVYITVHPGSVAPNIVATVDTVVAVGEHPERRLRELAEVAAKPLLPTPEIERLPAGHALYWRIGSAPVEIATQRSRTERTRHSRKYSEGNLGHQRSFFFRGPDNKLNLRAQNLYLFMQLGEGVDEDTWMFHLRRGEYSRWIRSQMKDAELADEVMRVEDDLALSCAASRARVRAAVEKRYTLPADAPSGVID